jgi:hypothetical protein
LLVVLGCHHEKYRFDGRAATTERFGSLGFTNRSPTQWRPSSAARGDEPSALGHPRIEERELEAGGLN